MTDRVEALIELLDQKAQGAMQALDDARGRIGSLEAENQSLRAELARLEQQGARATADAAVAESVSSSNSQSDAATSHTEAAGDATDPAPEDAPAALVSGSSASPEDIAAAASEGGVDVASAASVAGDSTDTTASTETHEDTTPAADGRTPPSPHALLNEWYERYPSAFFKAHTRPLKVGIHKDLIAREPWSAKLIRRALANYVNLPRYLKSVRTGIERVDLDGAEAGTINEEDVAHAREQLDNLHKRRQAREERQSAERMSRKLAALNSRLGH